MSHNLIKEQKMTNACIFDLEIKKTISIKKHLVKDLSYNKKYYDSIINS